MLLIPFRKDRQEIPRVKEEEGGDGKRAWLQAAADARVDEALALFRMNFYEISRHKTRAGPIGTYVRTLHPATAIAAVAAAVAVKHKSSRDRLGRAQR